MDLLHRSFWRHNQWAARLSYHPQGPMIVQPDFADHWKTNLLVRLCGKEDVIRCVLRFWAHCQNRKKWKFTDMNPQVLASICRWDGDAQIFWDAMAQTFMDVNNGSVIAHEWDDVNASLIGRWKGGETNKKQILAKLSKPHTKATSLATTSDGSDRGIRLDRSEGLDKSRVDGNGTDAFSSLQKALKEMFHWPANKPLRNIEEMALFEVLKNPDCLEEFKILKSYRAKLSSKDHKYFPHSMLSLLEKWNQFVDTARNQKEETCL